MFSDTTTILVLYEREGESVYERCDAGLHAKGVKCGVVEWMKTNTIRWFGYMGRKKSEEFVKKVYES